MALQFYNTLGRKKQIFKPKEEGKVGLYSCGPTVYNYVHIGNLRAYIFVDLLKRYLKFKGFKVTHVMNLTDVDDKTIRDSQKEGKTLTEFTEFYSTEFLKDMHSLNILMPDIMPKATEHITEMVDIIEKMKGKGVTYERAGSTYCKISEVPTYGKLACLSVDNLKSNADGRMHNADEYEKDDARDFALWKAWDDADGNVFWETSLGKGRPGWHIECSAMATKYLGKQFDIHTGGVDLIFPHHTNEIAQSESAFGVKPFVAYWMHNAHLIVNGQKMSKSAGNFYTLRDLLQKGYAKRAIRYELLRTHYRAQLDFREDELQKIPETLERFDELVNKLQTLSQKSAEDIETLPGKAQSIVDTHIQAFSDFMDDDLNISGGLSALFEYMRQVNGLVAENLVNAEDAKVFFAGLQQFDSVLGVMDFSVEDIPDEVHALAKKRWEAKNAKDWSTADSLREEIGKHGFILIDDKEGYRIKKK